MKRLLGVFVLPLLSCSIAHAEGAAALFLGFADSDASHTLRAEPRGEISWLSRRAESWEGSLAIEARSFPESTLTWRHEFGLRELRLQRDFEKWHLAVGRLRPRVRGLDVSAGVEEFLHPAPSVDGLWVEALGENLTARLFAGAPAVGGFSLAYAVGGFDLGVLYRGERGALVLVPATGDEGLRSVHLHDWELSLTTSADPWRVTGFFEGRHWHALRFAETTDARLGKVRVGDVDDSLPRSSASYHAATEIAFEMMGNHEHKSHVVAAAAAGARVHAWTNARENGGRRPAGSTTQYTICVDDVWTTWRGEVGLGLTRDSKSRLFGWFSGSFAL